MADFVRRWFMIAYEECAHERGFTGDLPMKTRGWQIDFVEARRLWMMLEFKPTPFNSDIVPVGVYFKENIPGLGELDDLEAIARACQLGEIIAGRPFLFGVQGPDAVQYYEQNPWVSDWARELADRHMADTHPSFDEARERMVNVYRTLFEFEDKMRSFTQQVLIDKYYQGWWSNVPIDVARKIEKRESGPSAKWFDSYSQSRFKFGDFDDIRTTILSKWPDFSGILGNKDLFISRMAILSGLRDRVAHSNTFSEDNASEFYTNVRLVLMAVNSYMKQRAELS